MLGVMLTPELKIDELIPESEVSLGRTFRASAGADCSWHRRDGTSVASGGLTCKKSIRGTWSRMLQEYKFKPVIKVVGAIIHQNQGTTENYDTFRSKSYVTS